LLEEARELARRTEGWLASVEGEALFGLASQCHPPGVIVEIGSWMGKSTTWLAKGSRSGSGLKVYAVDPHRRRRGTFEEFMRNMEHAGIEDLVVPYVMTSAEAAPKVNDRVVLAFVDGSHKYEDVKLDVKLWFPKVVEGGCMVFHDAVGNGAAGVHRAVREDVYESGRFRNVKLVGSMVICQKGSCSELRQKLRIRWNLIIFDMSDVVFDVSGRRHTKHYLPGPLLSRVRRALRWLQLNTAKTEDWP
jgi:predicted O-methyltransferase YrrM